jgi:BatD DUF11 like domain
MITPGGSRAAGWPLLAWMILAFSPALQAAELKTVLERDRVYQGESFLLQVQVLGASTVEEPGMPDLKDFDVREIPVNWIRARGGRRLAPFDLETGSNFLYRLVALRPGVLSIPPIRVEADGEVLTSKAAVVRVLSPPPSEDFKLSLTLSKRRVYVGEPLTVRVVWYYRLQGRYYAVNIPLLRHPSFKESGSSSGASPTLRPMSGAAAWAGVEGTALLNGMPYDTVSFEQVLIPTEAGRFDFPAATVQVWGAGEAEDSSKHGRWDYDSTVVGSQPLGVLVLPVPQEGRPGNFSGLVSDTLRLRAAIEPAEMNVGDPVTLSLTLSGPAAIEQARLPPLDSFAQLARDFILRSDSLREQVEEKQKVFQVSLRVKGEQVRELPSLEVPYFNTRTGTYQLARSAAVPITVRPTRVLTEADLEGAQPLAALKSSAWNVRDWKDGILFNYADPPSLLAREAGVGELARRPEVIGLLAGPAALLALAAVLALRRRAARLAAAGGPELMPQPAAPPAPAAGTGSAEEALAACRELLKSRLGLPPGRMTGLDVQAELSGRGLAPELVEQARELFDRDERRRYCVTVQEPAEEQRALAERAARLAEQLDRLLG